MQLRVPFKLLKQAPMGINVEIIETFGEKTAIKMITIWRNQQKKKPRR